MYFAGMDGGFFWEDYLKMGAPGLAIWALR